MQAIVETGGKQYLVKEGDVITVEKLPAAVGEVVSLDRVLFVNTGEKVLVGSPLVKGARAVARVLDQGKGRKVLVFRYKPKKNVRRRYGHRQPFTRLKIEQIEV